MIYRAKRGFSTTDKKGRQMYVHAEETTEDGHWLLKQCPDNFEPLEVTHPVEQKPDTTSRGRGKQEPQKDPADADKAAA